MKRGSQPKFSREYAQRGALLKGLLSSLIEHGRITTTETRAKALRIEADKLVTTAKAGTMHGRRLLGRSIGAVAAKKLTVEIAPTFAARQGGYTRVLKLGRRTSDAAPMAIIEFVK